MLKLPYRAGERPKTNYCQPHEQLTQNAPPEIYARLKQHAFEFPFVERRASLVSVPGAEALWLDEEGGHGCAEAFMRGNEFAHVHPPRDGSMHMMLPVDNVSELLERGWGELHPLVEEGRLPPTSVMVYGPRDPDELKIAVGLIEASYNFARGR